MSETKELYQAFEIKAYTKKDLRLLYGIPYHTFKRWLLVLPETSTPSRKNWLTAIQVEAIIKTYGVPREKQYQKIVY
jgi:hypothetical protein